MDNTMALIIVGVLVLAALVAAAGGFGYTSRRSRRTVVRDRPAERVVERPVAEERTERRVVE